MRTAGFSDEEIGWIDEGYGVWQDYLDARNLSHGDQQNWYTSNANVGHGLTVPHFQKKAIEKWTAIYIIQSYNQNLEREFLQRPSELNINFAARKFQYMRLFLHEFTHFAQLITGHRAVKDTPVDGWDNGAQFEFVTFGFTNSNSGIQGVSEEIKAKQGTLLKGVIEYLDGMEAYAPILEGITWNTHSLPSLKERILETGQRTFKLDSKENE